MSTPKSQLLTLIMGLLFFFPVFPQSITTMNFLTFHADPVTSGRGGAGVAADEYSIFSNPANLFASQKYQSFFYKRNISSTPIVDYNFFTAGGAYQMDKKNVLGVTYRRIGYGDIYGTGSEGETTQKESAYEADVALRYARKHTRNLTLGLTLHFLQRHTYPDVNSWAVDLGIKWAQLWPALTIDRTGSVQNNGNPTHPPSPKGVNIGVALLNAGPHISYVNSDQGDPIPQRLKLGVCHHLYTADTYALNLYFDYEKELVHRENREADPFYKGWITGWKNPPLREAYYSMGGELELIPILIFRYGYSSYGFNPDKTYYNSHTFGFSLDLKYVTIHYSQFMNDAQYGGFRKDTKLFGITLNDLAFLQKNQ